jgi:hypothetical protein
MQTLYYIQVTSLEGNFMTCVEIFLSSMSYTFFGWRAGMACECGVLGLYPRTLPPLATMTLKHICIFHTPELQPFYHCTTLTAYFFTNIGLIS